MLVCVRVLVDVNAHVHDDAHVHTLVDVDMNVSGESVEPVENVFFGDEERGVEAMRGKYKVYVVNYSCALARLDPTTSNPRPLGCATTSGRRRGPANKCSACRKHNPP